MKTVETLDYKKVLQDFTYKPNFFFALYKPSDSAHWWLRITMLVENSRRPLRMWETEMDEPEFMYGYPIQPPVYWSPRREVIEVQGSYPIPLFFGPEQEAEFVSWLVYTTKSTEEHEQDEWFRYKGELINDPHKED